MPVKKLLSSLHTAYRDTYGSPLLPYTLGTAVLRTAITACAPGAPEVFSRAVLVADSESPPPSPDVQSDGERSP